MPFAGVFCMRNFATRYKERRNLKFKTQTVFPTTTTAATTSIRNGKGPIKNNESIRMIHHVKKSKAEIDDFILKAIGVREELGENILNHIDVLVDGRFEEDKKDISLKFRGSSNQRLIFLTDRYNEGDIVRDAKRSVTLEINCDETSMSGIPSEADKNIWNSIIKSKL